MNRIDLDTGLLELLPPWYREILDYQEICQTEKEQFATLAEEIASVADNFFFQTMDEPAISMWEQILNIMPDPGKESLEFRRERALNRISSRPPYTLGFLYQRLDDLIGIGRWNVTVDYPNYTLYIESSAENQQYATEVAYTVNSIKPAHIVYINVPYLSAKVQLNETIHLSQRMYNYQLGSWGIGVLPFATEQEQGEIKMPSTQSIRDDLLSDTAHFLSEDISKARMNSLEIISSLSKSVEGSTITITYAVPQSLSSEITKVELLDDSNNVLTSSSVYIPVESSTVLKHVINVKEGI